jgi:glycosyltransferase involved in cell wall biosynthesis
MKLSVVIPIHDMKGGADFLWRSVNALMEQSFQDFEIVITKQGRMAENTNAGIKRAKGELIKILYLDDYLAHKDALKEIVEAFEAKPEAMWLITPADNNLHPVYTQDIHRGNNRLGSPSALTIRNKNPLLFDEEMSWMLDCDLYKRMYDTYGEPIILKNVGVNIGIHDGQMTNLLTTDEKNLEVRLIINKHE